MDRLQQKHELLVKLGMLFGPLLRLLEKPDQYNAQERAETIARYCAEYPDLEQQFRDFIVGQPGHVYAVEGCQFYTALTTVRVNLALGQDFAKVVPKSFEMARDALDAVPVGSNSVILEAGTPFSTYCRLKSLCEVDATTELVWIDAYVAASIFHRFLRDVRPRASIALITSEPKATAGKRDKDRWAEFLDTSRLFAQERDTAHYRLVVHQGLLHDRWLLFDQKRLFSLGGSAKDAGDKQYFTIATVEATQSNLGQVQAHVTGGTEFFGPSTSQHR